MSYVLAQNIYVLAQVPIATCGPHNAFYMANGAPSQADGSFYYLDGSWTTDGSLGVYDDVFGNDAHSGCGGASTRCEASLSGACPSTCTNYCGQYTKIDAGFSLPGDVTDTTTLTMQYGLVATSIVGGACFTFNLHSSYGVNSPVRVNLIANSVSVGTVDTPGGTAAPCIAACARRPCEGRQ